jgi:hypothetical protein
MSIPEIEFITQTPLPPAPSRERGEMVTLPSFTAERQAVAVGSQIAEFDPVLAPALRADLGNALLLAQLAADKAAGSPPQDFIGWYRAYVGALKRIGWIVGDLDFREQALSADGALVHKEIIPVVTAFLGPAASAVSIVVGLLNSLQAIQADQPWITLFQSESQTLNGAKFQINIVGEDQNGDPSINVLAVGIKASQRITQVLFFKAQQQSTRLEKAAATMSMPAALLGKIREVLADRVEVYVADNIKNIEI